MHEWCRRESATARRHLREHAASRDEREIQLRRAASRASDVGCRSALSSRSRPAAASVSGVSAGASAGAGAGMSCR